MLFGGLGHKETVGSFRGDKTTMNENSAIPIDLTAREVPQTKY